MFVQVVPLVDTWIWKAVAYAASQISVAPQTDTAVPRATWIHCGSADALAQRVPVLPSNADAAGVPAFSVDDAVAVLPCAVLVVPQVRGGPGVPPKTWNSHSDTPHAVAFAVALTRT